MKKRYLKKWVQIILAMILLISIVILGAESETYFLTSKIVAMMIFLMSGYVLFKYSKFED